MRPRRSLVQYDTRFMAGQGDTCPADEPSNRSTPPRRKAKVKPTRKRKWEPLIWEEYFDTLAGYSVR